MVGVVNQLNPSVLRLLHGVLRLHNSSASLRGRLQGVDFPFAFVFRNGVNLLVRLL